MRLIDEPVKHRFVAPGFGEELWPYLEWQVGGLIRRRSHAQIDPGKAAQNGDS